MTDFQGAVEKALYERLIAQVSGAQVFQHVPDDTPPPVVIVGDVTIEEDGSKDADLLRFEVQISCVVQGPGRRPLNQLQAQVRSALHRWRPAATINVQFGEISIISSSGQEIQAAQGPVYYGQQSAILYVQAA